MHPNCVPPAVTDDATLSDFVDDDGSGGTGSDGAETADAERDETEAEDVEPDRIEAERSDADAGPTEGSGAGDGPDEAERTESVSATGDVEPTYVWDPDGRCDDCGELVRGRWRAGDQVVCGACAEW